MPSGRWSRLPRVRVTLAYAVLLVVVAETLSRVSPDVQERVIRHASTNLDNLRHGHVGTLVASAFIVDAEPMSVWLPGLMCLLAAAELVWRSGRMSLAFAVGHVGATLLVAMGLAVALRYGRLSGDVTSATDVGMSYGATAVLGALTPAIPGRWRPAWIGWWLAIGVAVVAGASDFTDAGHVMALIIGMAMATRFGIPGGWTPVRVGLLLLGAGFGYLILVSGAGSMMPATVAGLAGAVFGAAVSRLLALVRSRQQPR